MMYIYIYIYIESIKSILKIPRHPRFIWIHRHWQVDHTHPKARCGAEGCTRGLRTGAEGCWGLHDLRLRGVWRISSLVTIPCFFAVFLFFAKGHLVDKKTWGKSARYLQNSPEEAWFPVDFPEQIPIEKPRMRPTPCPTTQQLGLDTRARNSPLVSWELKNELSSRIILRH